MDNIRGVTGNLNNLMSSALDKESKNSEINKNIVAQILVGQLSTQLDEKTETVVLDLLASVLKNENHKADPSTVKTVIKQTHPDLFVHGNKEREVVLGKINRALVDWTESIKNTNVIDITGRAKAK